MSKYKLEKNRNNSTGYDLRIIAAEGTYDSFDDAIGALGFDAELSDVNGELWMYAEGTTIEDMQADIEGYHMIGKISAED